MVWTMKSACGGPAWAPLPVCRDRHEMDAGGTTDPTSRARRRAAHGECARPAERGVLRSFNQLPVGGAVEGAAAKRGVDDFSRWHWEGTVVRIHTALCLVVRKQAGREASLTTVTSGTEARPNAIARRRRRRQEGATLDSSGDDTGK